LNTDRHRLQSTGKNLCILPGTLSGQSHVFRIISRHSAYRPAGGAGFCAGLRRRKSSGEDAENSQTPDGSRRAAFTERHLRSSVLIHHIPNHFFRQCIKVNSVQ
jgi:hypothetical protein